MANLLKVKDLIEELKKFDPEATVVAANAEGEYYEAKCADTFNEDGSYVYIVPNTEDEDTCVW